MPFEVFPAMGLLLVVIGWPLATRRIPRNRWYGFRVPATFADEQVWYETNAVAGRDMMTLGAALVVVALALPRLIGLPDDVVVLVCAALVGVGSLVITVRGWRLANRLLRERRGSRAV